MSQLPPNAFNGIVMRLMVCLVMPPLAVIDKGCLAIIAVTMLTIAGFVPGVFGAIVLSLFYHPPAKLVVVPIVDRTPAVSFEKPKRKPKYVRLNDGEIGRLVEDEGVTPASDLFDDAEHY